MLPIKRNQKENKSLKHYLIRPLIKDLDSRKNDVGCSIKVRRDPLLPVVNPGIRERFISPFPVRMWQSQIQGLSSYDLLITKIWGPTGLGFL